MFLEIMMRRTRRNQLIQVCRGQSRYVLLAQGLVLACSSLKMFQSLAVLAVTDGCVPV